MIVKCTCIYGSVVNSYEGALATRLSSLTLSEQKQDQSDTLSSGVQHDSGYISITQIMSKRQSVLFSLCPNSVVSHKVEKVDMNFVTKADLPLTLTSLCQSLQIPH